MIRTDEPPVISAKHRYIVTNTLIMWPRRSIVPRINVRPVTCTLDYNKDKMLPRLVLKPFINPNTDDGW